MGRHHLRKGGHHLGYPIMFAALQISIFIFINNSKVEYECYIKGNKTYMLHKTVEVPGQDQNWQGHDVTCISNEKSHKPDKPCERKHEDTLVI